MELVVEGLDGLFFKELEGNRNNKPFRIYLVFSRDNEGLLAAFPQPAHDRGVLCSVLGLCSLGLIRDLLTHFSIPFTPRSRRAGISPSQKTATHSSRTVIASPSPKACRKFGCPPLLEDALYPIVYVTGVISATPPALSLRWVAAGASSEVALGIRGGEHGLLLCKLHMKYICIGSPG